MCNLLAKYDKSKFNTPASETEIVRFQQKNSIVLPKELTDLYQSTNGFQVLGRTVTVYELDRVGFRFDDVPEDYIVFGEIAGDGEKLCFHEKTGEIVTVYNGRIFSYSIEWFLDYCIEQCKDGFFMSKVGINECSELEPDILKAIRKIYELKAVTIKNLTESFICYNNEQREKFIFDLPIIVRAAIFSFLEKSHCKDFIDYLKSKDNIMADNFIRGMKRRSIDNYFNRERKFLDEGKQTYLWNISQLKELYIFDDSGASCVNAGIVKAYDENGKLKCEMLKNKANEECLFDKKMEIIYVNDVYSDYQYLGNVTNVRVKG